MFDRINALHASLCAHTSIVRYALCAVPLHGPFPITFSCPSPSVLSLTFLSCPPSLALPPTSFVYLLFPVPRTSLSQLWSLVSCLLPRPLRVTLFALAAGTCLVLCLPCLYITACSPFTHPIPPCPVSPLHLAISCSPLSSIRFLSCSSSGLVLSPFSLVLVFVFLLLPSPLVLSLCRALWVPGCRLLVLGALRLLAFSPPSCPPSSAPAH